MSHREAPCLPCQTDAKENILLHLFSVSGMTCGHCEKAVTRAVQALDGQATVTIDRAVGRVQVNSEQPWQALAQAILDEGYAVTAPPAAG
jgi:copper chaperone